MRLRTLFIATLSLALGTAVPLEAQRVPDAGTWSISAQLFDDDIGTVFGLWR